MSLDGLFKGHLMLMVYAIYKFNVLVMSMKQMKIKITLQHLHGN